MCCSSCLGALNSPLVRQLRPFSHENLLRLGALATLATLGLVSCPPLSSHAIRHDRGPVYTMPESWDSGGHYAGFSASRPLANGYNYSSGAPC